MPIVALKKSKLLKNVLKLRWLIILVACLAVAFYFKRPTLPLFSQGLSRSDYKVVDSGFWVSPTRKILWLDNHRIMFQSNQTLSPDRYDYEGGFKNVVWDTSDGTVSFAGSWKKSRIVCAKEDQVVCVKMDPLKNQTAWYRGPLGYLKPYPRPDEDMIIDKEFDCAWEPKKDIWDYLGVSRPYPWKYRLCGMNYLEFVEREIDPNPMPHCRLMDIIPERRTQAEIARQTPFIEKAIYYERAGGEGIPLPINFGGWSKCKLYTIRYIEWKTAYFLYTGKYYDEYPIRAWWINSKGRIVEKKFPVKLPILSGSEISIYPVKPGYFLKVWGAQRPNAYLIEDDKIKELIKYPIIGRVSVSPDGCKAAFAHTTNIRKLAFGNDKDRTIKIINFCKNEVIK
nr:hypothetical protein [uncultured Desulfobacter sp.]